VVEEERKQGGAVGILAMVKKFINVKDLDIDLIDQINPFRQAYEVLSKSFDSGTLGQIQEAIAGRKIVITEEEAVRLFPKLKKFVSDHNRHPSLSSADPVERTLAEARAWILAKKRERDRQVKRQADV
jgi:hypothetical protein